MIVDQAIAVHDILSRRVLMMCSSLCDIVVITFLLDQQPHVYAYIYTVRGHM